MNPVGRRNELSAQLFATVPTTGGSAAATAAWIGARARSEAGMPRMTMRQRQRGAEGDDERDIGGPFPSGSSSASATEVYRVRIMYSENCPDVKETLEDRQTVLGRETRATHPDSRRPRSATQEA